MPTFRIKADGYFMGKYYKAGAELVLHEREAKYALLSEQLERVGTFSKHAEEVTPITPLRTQRVDDGERFGRNTVGASVSGNMTVKR